MPFLDARLPIPPSCLYLCLYLCRGLGDDEPAAGHEKGCGALRHHRRGSEGSGHDTREEPSIQGVPAAQFGPLVHHADTCGDAAPLHSAAEELGPTPIGLKKYDLRLRQKDSDDQPRQTTPRPQIQKACRGVARLRFGQSDKSLSVENLPLYRSGAEEPGLLRRKEDTPEDGR